MIKGYWKMYGKQPIAKEKEMIMLHDPPDHVDYCAVYEDGIIQIDIDDYEKESFKPIDQIHGKERSLLLIEYLDHLGIKYNGIKTERGRHFIFKLPDNYPYDTNKNDWYCPLGIQIEAKRTKVREILRIGGNERKFFKGSLNNDQIDFLPEELFPLQKSKDKPFPIVFEKGDRDNNLSAYTLHLGQEKVSRDAINRIIPWVNKNIAEEPLPDAEIENILRKETQEKLKAIEADQEKKSKPVTPELFKEFLISKGISIRYNELTNVIEYSVPDEQAYKEITDVPNVMPIQIQYDFQNYTGKRNISKHQIIDLIILEADLNTFNPVKDYLQAVKWDEKDRFPMIFEILGVNDPLQQTFLKKWFYQTAGLAFNTMDDPIQAEGVLILQGIEGIGKTRFLQQISINPLWFSSLDKELTTKNKDILIQMLSVWIAEVGEIDRTFKANKSDVKSFITSRDDTIRKPYRMEQVKKARTTSFCGTTNKESFLDEDTGSRRWWVVQITRRVHMEAFMKNPENIHQLWVQCYETFKKDPLCFRLNDEELSLLEEHNRDVTEMLPSEEELRNRMDFEASEEDWKWIRPSVLINIPEYDVQKYSAKQIGQALTKIMKDERRIKKKRDNSGNIYFIPPSIFITDRYRNKK